MHLVCMNARLVYAREVCAQLKRAARIKMIPNFVWLNSGEKSSSTQTGVYDFLYIQNPV